MTWTTAADAVMPVCARAAAACPPAPGIVTDRIAITAAWLFPRKPVQHTTCRFAAVLVASPGPGAVPTAACGSRRHPGRPECARPPRQREPGCVRRLHLLGADLAIPGWPPDPGREVL
jgi:hypothetical protein